MLTSLLTTLNRSLLNATCGFAIASVVLGALPALADDAQDAAVKEFQTQPRWDMPMRITQREWSPQMEDLYSQFVAQVGRGIKAKPFRTVKAYMKDPAVNPYAHTDPAGLVLYSDCADLPYFLRIYFAAKNGLPFSLAQNPVMNMRPYASMPTRDNDLLDGKTESSPYGNMISGRGASNMPSAPGREKNFVNYWTLAMDSVSTRTFRVGPLTPGYELSDVYPVRIDRDGVRPGTIVHTNGHIYVVTEIDHKGTISMVDAHPDNSVSFKILDASKLNRSRPDHGFGLFRFRPLRVVNAQYTNGAFYGGRIESMSDFELYSNGQYSLEQWYGPGSRLAPNATVQPTDYQVAYRGIDFFDFVRSRLKQAGITTPADQAIGDIMVALCDEFKQRVTDVEAAIAAGMNRLAHPRELPDNVFSTVGPWETFSSPSRDGRLREAVANLPRSTVQKFRQAKQSAADFTFNGTATDYQRAILSRLAIMDSTCQVPYKTSNGRQVSMPFSDLARRVPRMSFDPYHCAERRWGASGAELAGCYDMDNQGWYDAQQVMRNTIGKQDINEQLVIRSDRPITIDMLRSGQYVDRAVGSRINLGSARSPVIDIKTYFQSQQFIQDLTR